MCVHVRICMCMSLLAQPSTDITPRGRNTTSQPKWHSNFVADVRRGQGGSRPNNVVEAERMGGHEEPQLSPEKAKESADVRESRQEDKEDSVARRARWLSWGICRRA